MIVNAAYREVFGGVRRHATAIPCAIGKSSSSSTRTRPRSWAAATSNAFQEHWLMSALAHFSATLQQCPEDP